MSNSPQPSVSPVSVSAAVVPFPFPCTSLATAGTHISSSTNVERETRRPCVLMVGLDGFRPDCLTAENAPTLCALMSGQYQPLKSSGTCAYTLHCQSLKSRSYTGCDACAYTLDCQVGDISWSGPGWSSMLTGVWRDKHGVNGNEFATETSTEQFEQYPAFFARIKAVKPDAVTAVVTNWKPIAAHILQPRYSDHSIVHEDDDAAVTASAKRLLESTQQLDCLMVHLDNVDHNGHEHGFAPHSKQYTDAVRVVDAQIRSILESLYVHRSAEWRQNEEWLVVISTDHGGCDRDHETNVPENRTTFVIMHGDASMVAAGEMSVPPVVCDIAPTILAHLQIPIQSAWHLDGRPIGLRMRKHGKRRAHWMDLKASQDPLKRFPADWLPPERRPQAAVEAKASIQQQCLHQHIDASAK